VLLERPGEAGVRDGLRYLDAIYRQTNGASVLVEVVERLSRAEAVDLAKADLTTYRRFVAPWSSWEHVRDRGRAWSKVVAELAMEEGGKEDDA
jgi:hypothetical protein